MPSAVIRPEYESFVYWERTGRKLRRVKPSEHSRNRIAAPR
jgi:hypothetical protein